MSSDNGTIAAGNSILGLLFILFVGLKLGNVITWSWWWVTIPLWGGSALVLLMFALIGIYIVIRA